MTTTTSHPSSNALISNIEIDIFVATLEPDQMELSMSSGAGYVLIVNQHNTGGGYGFGSWDNILL